MSCFLVALAYEREAAGTELVAIDAEFDAALFVLCATLLAGLGADETVLLIRSFVDGIVMRCGVDGTRMSSRGFY